jgi:hypothetical protein
MIAIILFDHSWPIPAALGLWEKHSTNRQKEHRTFAILAHYDVKIQSRKECRLTPQSPNACSCINMIRKVFHLEHWKKENKSPFDSKVGVGGAIGSEAVGKLQRKEERIDSIE